MATLTIAAAARHCGVARRTLQRAIRAGRLPLTPDHRLTLAALAQAGYLPATAPQRHHSATTQRRDTATHRSDLEPVSVPLLDRLDRLIAAVENLCTLLASQSTAAPPPRHAPAADRRATAATPQRPPGTRTHVPGYDPAVAAARIATLRQEGLSLEQIAARLNAEGLPTRRGLPWKKGLVGWFLKQGAVDTAEEGAPARGESLPLK